MTADDELARLFEQRAKADGPVVDSIDRIERIAGLLGEIRSTAARKTHYSEQSGLSWNTPTMDHAPVGMAISGPAYQDNPIYYANETFESITGYAECDVLGDNLRLLQGPETAADAVADLHEAIDIWAPVVVDIRNYRADGTPFMNHLALAPIADETGTISNWVGLQQGITETP